MKINFTRFFLVCFALLTILGIGWSQGSTAAINGQITDSSGAAIPNASVTARDLDHGTIWPATADERGFYNLPRLPIGKYELRAQANGFQSAVRNSVELVLDQVAKLDFQLQVGQISQTLEVTSAAPLLQTESTQVSTIMEAQAIESLPLETRNYNQLALLMPGAITTSPASFNTGQQTFNAGRPYINGNREQATYYLLDGMENIEFVDNNVAYSPSVDAIQEFDVVTNNPSAEYGQFLGGVISVSLKSGSNSYHGGAFEFLRNDFFNANEWSRNFSGLASVNSAPPNLRWNEFGGTFGGPIKKNKLFFFVDYQGSQVRYAADGRLSQHVYVARAQWRLVGYFRNQFALSGNERSPASQSEPSGNLRRRREDGLFALHQRNQRHCVEDRGCPAPAHAFRAAEECAKRAGYLCKWRSGRRKSGLQPFR